MQLSTTDQLSLGALPLNVRSEVEKWLNLLRPVSIAIQSGKPKCATIEAAARGAGVPVSTFRRKWDNYRRKGWKGLINQAKYPVDRAVGLPRPFIQHWHSILAQHQRDTSGRRAYAALIKQWRAWLDGDDSAAIPGYDSPPPATRYSTGIHPAGWSLSNLAKHGLSTYNKTLHRQGTMAAKAHLPSVRTTRVGMEVMQMVMFDDQWHDTLVNFIDAKGMVINRKAMRPLSFNALDVSSGCDFTRAYKPIIWDAETETRKMLTEADFFWFLIHVLSEYGWRSDIGTVFVVEHGTANVDGPIKDAITRATEGKVTFSSGGILGAPLRKGMLFEGQPRGNFKFKAHRESWFNLFRNYMAYLPGATGLNPSKAPEENYGLAKYNNMLLRVMEKLNPQRAAMLMHPLLNWHQYVPLCNHITELINQRVDHQLEGWEAMGRIAHEVRLTQDSQQWLSMADIARLPDPNSQALALNLMQAPGHGRSRNLSPREVYDQGIGEAPMTKLNPHLWNLVIPNDYAHEVRVTSQHEIIIRDKLITPEPMRFVSLARNSRGREELIPPGEMVRVYVNPFHPQQALVCEMNDAAIGLVQRLQIASRMDLDGMARAYGTIKHLESHLQREAAQRAESVMAERQAMQRHNAAVLDGAPVTSAEHAAVKRSRRAARLADQLMDADAPDAPFPAHGTNPEPQPLIDPLDQ